MPGARPAGRLWRLGRVVAAGAACAWLGFALAGWLGRGSYPLAEVVRESARGEALEAEWVGARQRLEARRQIIRDVAEGRISLAEGRGRLAAVLRQWPGYASAARWLDREGPEQDRLNRQILEEVRVLGKTTQPTGRAALPNT
jgi:hypothetical protein